MRTTIVVGSDGSAPSRSALSWAARRADALGMDVHLCRVVDDEWTAADQGLFVPEEEVLAALEREAQSARSAFPGVLIRSSLRRGRPVAVLAGLASDADLLVVGTHKTGFIHGRGFESRFAGLVSLTDTAVAFIPDSISPRRRGVVAGLVRWQQNTAVLQYAAAEATRLEDHLVLLESWEDTSVAGTTIDRAPLISASIDESLRLATAHASADHPDLEIRVRPVHRNAADALIDASLSARLLVIGHSVDPLRASVTHDVLLNLACPTIVVRDAPPESAPAAASSAHVVFAS